MLDQSELIRAANAAVMAHEARRQGVEQRAPSVVKADNSFVNLWLATFHDAAKK